MGQPDLDFTAPEVQMSSTCSPQSDMFSLGLLITCLYNNGKSLVDANLSATNYSKQLEAVSGSSLHLVLPCLIPYEPELKPLGYFYSPCSTKNFEAIAASLPIRNKALAIGYLWRILDLYYSWSP